MDQGHIYGENDPSHASQYAVNNMQPLQHRHQQHQQQPAFTQWAAQPITAYQLVPMDGTCVGYQPVYAHQQPQQAQPPRAALYTFPSTIAMCPISPISPTDSQLMTPVGSGVSPLRRQVSVGLMQTTQTGSGSYYQPSPPQYQQYHSVQCQPQHQQQQDNHHQQQHLQQQYRQQQLPFQSVASMHTVSTHVPSGSPEASRQFHFSPARRAPQPYPSDMVFATPPPTRHQDTVDPFTDMPPAPATLPRLAPRQTSLMMRPNKPQPLALASSHLRHDGRSLRSSSLPVVHRKSVAVIAAPSVTPVGSDREYDGGDSSYSTSPLGSESNATRLRQRSQFVPRMPKYVRTAAAVPAEPPSPTPRLRTLRPSAHETSHLGQQQFLEDHIHAIETQYSDDRASEANSAALSSSDEWYTTTDTNPVRSRHRHRVAEDETVPGGPGLCNCGMQQCCLCGLFISRPETHACMDEIGAFCPS